MAAATAPPAQKASGNKRKRPGLEISLPETSHEGLRLSIPPDLLSPTTAAQSYQPPKTPRDVNASRSTPLHAAVLSANLSQLEHELEKWPQHIDVQEEHGYTPIMSASALRDADTGLLMARKLLEHGANIMLADNEGFTCLHWAAAIGNVRTLLCLGVTGGPTLTQARSAQGETALHRACRLGCIGSVVALISPLMRDAGVELSPINNEGETPLDVAGIALARQAPARLVVRRTMLSCCPSLRTLVLHHSECLEHANPESSGGEGGHQEAPARLVAIMQRVRPVQSSRTPHQQSRLSAPASSASKAHDAKLQNEPCGNAENASTEAAIAAVAAEAAKASEGVTICSSDVEEGGKVPGTFAPWELDVSSSFEPAPLRAVERAHSLAYVSFVQSLAGAVARQGNKHSVAFTPRVQLNVARTRPDRIKDGAMSDTMFSAGSFSAALRAAGAVCHAVDTVINGNARNAFCVVRPPGHHSGVDGLLAGSISCGFCIFNSVIIGGLHALAEHPSHVQRVAVVDFDVHHGNGSEDIIRRYNRPDRLFLASIHLYDKEPAEEYEFYPGSGASDLLPQNVVNVALSPLWRAHDNASSGNSGRNDTGRSPRARSRLAGRLAWKSQLEQRVLPALRAFQPDIIFLSAGFDGGKGDVGNVKLDVTARRTQGLDLLPADYEWLVGQVQRIANLCCAGRVVSVLEGGYGQIGRGGTSLPSAEAVPALDLQAFSDCCAAHLSGLAGQRPPSDRGKSAHATFSTISSPVPGGRGGRSRSHTASASGPEASDSDATVVPNAVTPRSIGTIRSGSGFRARRSPRNTKVEPIKQHHWEAPLPPTPPPPVASPLTSAPAAGSATPVFWEINQILKRRKKKGAGSGSHSASSTDNSFEYLVSWQGFPAAADNTWEPHANLQQDCPLLLERFIEDLVASK